MNWLVLLFSPSDAEEVDDKVNSTTDDDDDATHLPPTPTSAIQCISVLFFLLPLILYTQAVVLCSLLLVWL